MYRFKTLTGHCLWARHIAAQATEVAVRVGVINRIADLARPQSVPFRPHARFMQQRTRRCHCVRVLDLCDNALFHEDKK
ncbi:MAG: hypothetical protein E5299_01664 [Burkholderia gladioli]|nr:MAG: hypothetical protein E5299_01664 [Burkholderia gladioli]